MKDYQFKWKPELQFAAITFVVFVLGEFVRTDGNTPESWGSWAVITAVAGARIVAASIIPRLVGRSA